MALLFEPFSLRDVTARNRIIAAPMSQYSADDNRMGAWHQVHLPGLARGGAGIVVIECTAVSPEGRISEFDLGLWDDAHAEAMAPVVARIKAAGAVAGLQLGHAGRKGSVNQPWEGDDHRADDVGGWPIIAPSAIAFGGPQLWKEPRAMSVEDIDRVQAAFVAAARRAYEAGVEWLELHFAHGYLGQSFFSQHSNQRTDAYGGSFENRARFLLETVAAVRKVWPDRLPLTARLGVVEFDGRDEETLTEAIALIQLLKREGLDLLSVSLGFSTVNAQIPWGTAFLATIGERVRCEADIPTSLGWGLGIPAVAEQVLRDGQADLVNVGRALLANPHWPYAAAHALGVSEPSWATLPAAYAHWLERYRP
jgi:2,4-dienoyl-CoA reductase-like NADH-dependent reductase (Old Yellow Enzyme family)